MGYGAPPSVKKTAKGIILKYNGPRADFLTYGYCFKVKTRDVVV
jgi:hypothetical protein